MDTLTHALSGALVARATEPAVFRSGALSRGARMWAGFFAAAFPDVDFIVRFVDPTTYLITHRGLTHSLVMLPLWALLLAALCALVSRGRYRARAFYGVCALGLAAHIAGDVITAFGTMVLAPLSAWRVALPTTFIIDAYFSAIIVAGLAASAWWRDTRRPAVLALVALALLVGFQGIQHQRALSVGEAYAARHGLEAAQVQAIPQPFSAFNWMVVVSEPDTYHLAYVNLARQAVRTVGPDAWWFVRIHAAYRPVDAVVWYRIARFGRAPGEIELAKSLWHSEVLAPYRHFALFPALYRIEQAGGERCVWFKDLRFALPGRRTPFGYGACQEIDGGGLRGAAEVIAPWQVPRLLTEDREATVPWPFD